MWPVLREVRAVLRLVALGLYGAVFAKWLGAPLPWVEYELAGACGSWLMGVAGARFANQHRWLDAKNVVQLVLFAGSSVLFPLALWARATALPDAVFAPSIVVSVVCLKVADYAQVEMRKACAVPRLVALGLYAAVFAKWLRAPLPWVHYGLASACGSWLMGVAGARFARGRRWLDASFLAQLALFAASGALFPLALWSYTTSLPGAVFMPRLAVSVVCLKVAECVGKRSIAKTMTIKA